jgi:hypothetical protein
MTTEKPRPMSSQEIFDTYEAELARLRQERDELVGALEDIRSIPLFANSDAEHVFAVQRIAKAILSKHKPE